MTQKIFLLLPHPHPPSYLRVISVLLLFNVFEPVTFTLIREHKPSTVHCFSPKTGGCLCPFVFGIGRVTNVKFPYRKSGNSFCECTISSVSFLNGNIRQKSFTRFFLISPRIVVHNQCCLLFKKTVGIQKSPSTKFPSIPIGILGT